MKWIPVLAVCAWIVGCSPTPPRSEPSTVPAKPASTDVAYFGVTVASVPEGIKLKTISKNSPAEKAGLRAKDVLISVNGCKVAKSAELKKAIFTTGAGKTATLSVKRGGNVSDIRVNLGSRRQDGEKPKAEKKKKAGEDDDGDDDDDDDDGMENGNDHQHEHHDMDDDDSEEDEDDDR
jgi:predicted metalloprotease with PDZ domain